MHAYNSLSITQIKYLTHLLRVLTKLHLSILTHLDITNTQIQHTQVMGLPQIEDYNSPTTHAQLKCYFFLSFFLLIFGPNAHHNTSHLIPWYKPCLWLKTPSYLLSKLVLHVGLSGIIKNPVFGVWVEEKWWKRGVLILKVQKIGF